MTLILNGSVGVSDVDGSAATPAIRGTDANTGMFFPAADTIAFAEGGVEAMRLDSSGNVGIGLVSPAAKLDVVGASGLTSFTGTSFLGLQLRGAASTNDYSGIGFSTTNQGAPTAKIAAYFSGAGSYLQFGTSNSYVGGVTNTAMTIDPSGNLQFNSGYGSAATAYGCRAWVNFNGTGTVAIRASGNVTSITDNGTGDYTVNITTAITDANYSIAVSGAQSTNETNRGLGEVIPGDITTSSFRLRTGYHIGSQAATDYAIVNAVVIR
jgi:hypothetical protein